MEVLQDIFFQFTFTPRPEYWVLHVVLLLGAFLLGLWQAYAIWREPWQHYRLSEVTDYGTSIEIEAESEPVEETKEPEPALAKELHEAPPKIETQEEFPVVTAEKPDEEKAEPVGEPEDSEEPELASEEPVYQPAATASSEVSKSKVPGMGEDPDLGLVYLQKPDHPDDLTIIDHINKRIQRRLNYYGIYRYEQIAEWSPHTMQVLSERLMIGDQIQREDWPDQAGQLAEHESYELAPSRSAAKDEPSTSSGGGPFDVLDQARVVDSPQNQSALFSGAEVETDPELGLIFLERPLETDDLKRIPALDDRLEKELNDLGIYRFEQIARWNRTNIEGFARRLDVGVQRIEGNRWVKVAEDMAADRAKMEMEG